MIVAIAADKGFTSFILESFWKIFKQNIIAILINDIRARVQINIKIASGLSKKTLNLLLISIKYIGENLLIV